MILCRSLSLLQLSIHGRNALLSRRGNFCGQWPAGNAPGSVVAITIIGNVYGGVIDNYSVRDCSVVHLNVADVHIVDGTVVVEAVSMPISTLITNANIAKSIINSAIVADVPAPKSVMIAVSAADKSPIPWRP
jgi:hypothetical protein